MIISVPHTGTRSLAEHLGETQFKHFGQSDSDFGDWHIDFPVRDPLDSFVSWVCFEGAHDNHGGFFERWELAIDYLKDKDVTYHKMEDLPILDGRGPRRNHPLRELVKDKDLDRLKRLGMAFLIWMQKPEIDEFFNQWYPERWYRCEISESTEQEYHRGQDLLRRISKGEPLKRFSSTERGLLLDLQTDMKLA